MLLWCFLIFHKNKNFTSSFKKESTSESKTFVSVRLVSDLMIYRRGSFNAALIHQLQPAFTCSVSKMETTEQCVKWRRYGVFIVNYAQISNIALTFFCRVWASKCRLEHVHLIFFLPGFSSTNIHESRDCRGRGRAFRYLLTTTSIRFTDTYTLAGRLLQRAHLCA